MIDIIMATYNGEKYIESQLLSIISQSFHDWTLHIYDDCSSDRTIDIIERYKKVDDRIKLHINEVNMGCSLTFLNAIKKSTAQFIMLCDQDDIWFDDKVYEMHHLLQKDSNIPSLGLSKGFAYNQDLKKFTGRINLNEPQFLNEFLLNNGGLQGCSMIINRKLIDLVSKIQCEVIMHDHYLSLLAFTFGKVKYLDMDLILYRRHEQTVTNNYYGSLLSKSLNYFKNNMYVIDELHYNAIYSFFNENKLYINHDMEKVFLNYFKLSQKNFIHIFFLIIKYKFCIRGSVLISLISFCFKKRKGINKKQKMVFWAAG